MTLPFVVGVMNLLLVAGLAGFVLIERLLSGGGALSRFAGVAMACWGLYLLLATQM